MKITSESQIKFFAYKKATHIQSRTLIHTHKYLEFFNCYKSRSCIYMRYPVHIYVQFLFNNKYFLCAYVKEFFFHTGVYIYICIYSHVHINTVWIRDLKNLYAKVSQNDEERFFLGKVKKNLIIQKVQRRE